MTGNLRVAVVGAGYFSQFHYEAWNRCSEATLVGLADLDAVRAADTADRHRVPAMFGSFDDLLDQTEPDLLDIVTPPQTHADIVAAAAKRGIAMICQKPLAPTLEESRRVVALADESGVDLVVHENFRFQPWYRHAKILLENGTLGKLHGIAFRLRPGDGQGPEAYLDRQPYFQQMPRFLIHETGIHFVDTFRFLMGEVTAVTAHLRRINPVIAGEDAGIVLFEFENGATGLFDGNRLNDHQAEDCRLTMGEMHLEGSAGVLRLDGEGRLWLKPHHEREREEQYHWQSKGFAGDCVYEQIRHIVAHFTEGQPVVNKGRDYLRNVEIVEAIYRSDEVGKRIVLG